MKRIDSLKPGTKVTLRFMREFQGTGSYDEDAIFEGITGTGDDRLATFSSTGDFSWSAYRFNGRWAYGSSAETLRLVAIHGEVPAR